MRRLIIIILVILLIAAGGYAAFRAGLLNRPGQSAATTPTANATPNQTGADAASATPEANRAADGSVVADARVVPVQEAQLSVSASGIVEEILVKEGQQVKTGDLLLRLSAAQQKVGVARAQADLQRAQARLDQVKAGARDAEIAQAQAALSAAQTRYDRLSKASLPGNIASAEAALSAAQAGLAKVMDGPSEQQIIEARAGVASAEAQVRQAQAAYNLVKFSPDIGALPQSAQLQQATISYEAAKARLADLQASPRQSDIAGASAQVRQAKAQLDKLKAEQPDDIAEAAAGVQQSQAQLDLLLAGARKEEVAAAEADVAAATTAVQQALVSLADTELRAPFAGTVAELNVNLGEQISPAASVVRLADLATWQIETEDLTELDVVGVNESTPVSLTFDAIPDLEMAGKVKYVKPLGKDNRGDIVYTVVIEPGQQDPRLLWNMTAVVTLKK
jgi:multidrug efflux pump subunit AcrA (membrane-fusion protein)